MALRNFTLLTLACHSEEERKYLRACQNHTKKTWIFQAPEAPANVEIIVLLNEKRRRQCRRYLAYIFFVITYVCSARLFCVERPQVVFYCNFSSSRHVSISTKLVGRIVLTRRVKPKNESEALKKKKRFYAWCFPSRALRVIL